MTPDHPEDCLSVHYTNVPWMTKALATGFWVDMDSRKAYLIRYRQVAMWEWETTWIESNDNMTTCYTKWWHTQPIEPQQGSLF